MPSRKPQKAVHSNDPGQSAWWLLAPTGGIVAGALIPYFATHSAAWATAGGFVGAAIGGDSDHNASVPRLGLGTLPQATDRRISGSGD